MKDFLEAITIMAKYTDAEYPVNCSHDQMNFNTIDASKVSPEDIKRLEELGFNVDNDIGGFYSFKYGSN